MIAFKALWLSLPERTATQAGIPRARPRAQTARARACCRLGHAFTHRADVKHHEHFAQGIIIQRSRAPLSPPRTCPPRRQSRKHAQEARHSTRHTIEKNSTAIGSPLAHAAQAPRAPVPATQVGGVARSDPPRPRFSSDDGAVHDQIGPAAAGSSARRGMCAAASASEGTGSTAIFSRSDRSTLSTESPRRNSVSTAHETRSNHAVRLRDKTAAQRVCSPTATFSTDGERMMVSNARTPTCSASAHDDRAMALTTLCNMISSWSSNHSLPLQGAESSRARGDKQARTAARRR